MKKINGQGFSLVEVLVVVAVLGLVVAAGYLLQKNTKSNNQAQRLTITELVAAIRHDITEKQVFVTETGAEDGNYNGYVHYRADGFDFMSIVESANYVNYRPKEPASLTSHNESDEQTVKEKDLKTMESTKNSIIKLVEENGFTEIADYPVANTFGEGRMYERELDVCAVNTGATVGVACATKAAFEQVANDVKPFVDVYRNAAEGPSPGAAFGLLETGTGATANDEYAIMSTGIAAAYFYQLNNEWVYFASSQEGIGCESTSEVAQAEKAFSKICRKSGEGL